MAAAICQVIPVGQPVLGTIGKLASFAADIKEEGTPDTLSKMGETIKKARESAAKAKKAKEEAKKKDKDPANKEEAKKGASAWAKAARLTMLSSTTRAMCQPLPVAPRCRIISAATARPSR